MTKPLPDTQLRRRRPPTRDTIEYAGRLLEDGASQLEVIRTVGVARETLVKHFPGKGWTYKQGGEFRALLRKPTAKELTR